jgi:hypothetical protein
VAVASFQVIGKDDGKGGSAMREIAERGLRTGLVLARHIVKYVSYQIATRR